LNKIKIKPMSVNESYQGSKVKTKKYRFYTRALMLMLPKLELPEPPYSINYEFGVSNMGADVDNPIKPFQDILQKRYGFNDSKIHEIKARKIKVEKGSEYIEFEINSLH